MKQILVIGDLHACSHFGPIMPNAIVTDSVNKMPVTLGNSPLQTFLYSKFSEMAYGVEWDYVFVNGDVCAGWNKGDNGRYLNTPDLAYQADVAAMMLKPISCKKMFFTMGTPYHSESDRPLEQIVAEKVAAFGTPTEFAFDFLFNIEGWKIHMAHCMDWKGSVTESLNREMGCQGADLVIRSHRHEYCYIDKGRRKGLATPCWEWRNAFGLINGMYNGTDIGMSSLNIAEDFINVDTELVDMRSFMQPRTL